MSASTPVTWPATLPLPSVEGYGVSPQEAVLRTEMESGPARQRRRFRQTPTRITVRWLFGEYQFALFEAWYKFHADEGGQWFEITLLGGLGLLPHEARFTRQFEARLLPARRWEVKGELEIRERPTLDEGAIGLLLESEPDALFVAIATLHRLVHVTAPNNL
ncbi:hypothetical protein [Rhodoferax antarcticus]|uniref:hypothetical protein n=1 Tax=Rhodoferax antarcticus TaxID=81479 RepID=UPI00222429C9|nr:hypothetical protein [Rhodoferax antarcticus]MCW2313356.1 hypothetical protein [Rhodoferax antarcticus]